MNARGDMRDPVVVSEFHMIMDHLSHEKAVAERKMSVRDLVSTPVARRRLLIGASPGLFSCIAGNIIASYYLSSELKAAGITNSNDQLKAVSRTCHVRELTSERCVECLVSRLLPVRHSTGGPMGPQVDCTRGPVHLHRVLDDHWRAHQEVLRGSGRRIQRACLRQRRVHLPVPGRLFAGVDPIVSVDRCCVDVRMSLYAPEILNYSIRANGVTVKQYANAIPAYVTERDRD